MPAQDRTSASTSAPLLAGAVQIVLLASAVLLGLGLVGPCMTIIPNFGEFDSWIRLLKPSAGQVSSYSVLSGILAMIDHGNVGIGLLLLFFSGVFPTFKLAAMAWAVPVVKSGRHAGWMLSVAHHTGKFSMLDVMVLALIVIAIKGLPGDTEIRLGWGVWAFAGSVVLSIVASILLYRLEKRLAPLPSQPAAASDTPPA